MAASNAVRRMIGGQRRPGYRSRRPLPAISILVLLAIVAVVVWVTAVRASSGRDNVMDCPSPTAKGVGQPLDPAALNHVKPQAPGQVQVRVLNGSGERGKATMVTAIVQQAGFKTDDPGNDNAYDGSLDCHGQIRFGPAGARAARTLSLLDPCNQLVRDDRPGPNIDFVIGTKFDDLRPTDATTKLMHQLQAVANGNARGVSQQLISQAHDLSNCE